MPAIKRGDRLPPLRERPLSYVLAAFPRPDLVVVPTSRRVGRTMARSDLERRHARLRFLHRAPPKHHEKTSPTRAPFAFSSFAGPGLTGARSSVTWSLQPFRPENMYSVGSNSVSGRLESHISSSVVLNWFTSFVSVCHHVNRTTV